ncbi:MAG: thermonuclease family protein [Pseudomonadota bacterium]
MALDVSGGRLAFVIMRQLSLFVRHLFFVPLTCLLFWACGQSAVLDVLPEGETGRVVRIIDGDALVLDTGLSVRLAGLEAPAPERRNRPGEPFANEASRMLEDMALGRRVTLYYPGLTRDRYNRALAYVVTVDDLGPKVWLNKELARRGGARVRVYPDTAALAENLLEAERLARIESIGLWGETSYRILSATALGRDEQGFRIVTAGGLRRTDIVDAERYSCALMTGDSAFFVDVGPAASEICLAPPDEALVRGYVRNGRMELTHGLNMQPLSP